MKHDISFGFEVTQDAVNRFLGAFLETKNKSKNLIRVLFKKDIIALRINLKELVGSILQRDITIAFKIKEVSINNNTIEIKFKSNYNRLIFIFSKIMAYFSNDFKGGSYKISGNLITLKYILPYIASGINTLDIKLENRLLIMKSSFDLKVIINKIFN